MKSLLLVRKTLVWGFSRFIVPLLLVVGLLRVGQPILARAKGALSNFPSNSSSINPNGMRSDYVRQLSDGLGEASSNSSILNGSYKIYLPFVSNMSSQAAKINPTSTFTSTPSATATKPASPTSTRTASATATPTAAPPDGQDPILYFVSDLVASGSLNRGQAVVNLITGLISQHPGTQIVVASGGDNEQESSPTLSNYQSYFGTTYQTFVNQGIFMQVRGNHDNSSAGSYSDYDGTSHSSGAAYWNYFGSDAHMDNIEGKKLTDYSYDMGTWHIIALDQVSSSVNQPSLNFLSADLAANTTSKCQLVYWHVPTYSSGATHGDALSLKPFNQVEYNAGVDIQLNGHDHDYQRFYPINPNGVRDNTSGITTFVAGIGGDDNRPGSRQSAAQAASAVYLDTFPGGSGHAIGVLQFILHSNSADYTLYDANDGSILDQGTIACH
jgi:hypothetical protein